MDYVDLDLPNHKFVCKGDWNLKHVNCISNQLRRLDLPSGGNFSLDGSQLGKLDSSGAWMLVKTAKRLSQKGFTLTREHFSEKAEKLLALIEANPFPETILKPKKLNGLAQLGKKSIEGLREFTAYLSFIGHLSIEALKIFRYPSRFRFSAIASTIDKTGYQALMIIALLSFMIGVVIAYQMGFQLRSYGANVFIVNLLGLSVLREFGPLLTAIMVAGRTGSSFTAQLGIMKLNQEMDALNTMGVPPASLLLIPRVIGLTLVLPLLTMWADVFGVMGGMVMANSMLSVNYYDFLQRFEQEIPLRSLLLGLCKAPVFALIISSIGCFEGTQVENNSESVGLKTTRSVVLSIFFIIIADAAFSILFSRLKL